MENKRCSRCKLTKPLTEFGRNKAQKDGYKNYCKLCVKENYLENIEQKRIYNKEYYFLNKEEINKKHKIWLENNIEYIKTYSKNYRNNDEFLAKEKERLKKYREENKELISEQQKKWRTENKKYTLDYAKKYRQENRKKINTWFTKKYSSDPLFKLKVNIRNAFKSMIKRNGFAKQCKTIDILGCSFEALKTHLESKFEPWMNWDNHGLYNGELNYGWDIDHIIPTSTAITEEDVIRLNHYTNLQPLCSKINRDIKRNKLE